ncbi:MAG: hypothetical protein H0T71_08560 [Acidobacteria bacterium]|nr:hypothetical protein [Acidobacteriota bacterium]
MTDRLDAQRRVNRIRAFRAEWDAVRLAGVTTLTSEQHRAIRAFHDDMLRELAARHDVDASDATGQLSRGMQLASFFAAIALTAAIYSLVSRFWGRLDLPLQVTILCAFPLMALVGVEFSARRERTLYVASVLALVAYGTYWLAVVVLSDVLNMPLTPAAIWAGALFGVSLAFPYGFRLLFGVALVALLVAFAGSVFDAADMPWTAAAEHLEIVTGAALALTLVGSRLSRFYPPFASVTRLVGFAVGFAGMLVLSSAGRMSLLPMSSSVAEWFYQVLTVLLCMVALVIAVRRRWDETVYVAAAALTLFLLLRCIDWFWVALPRFLFFLLLAAIAFAWLFVLRRVRGRLVARALA